MIRPVRRRRVLSAATCVAALALAAPALATAHVTVVPHQAPAGAYTVFDVRVPNERDDASTVRVDLQLPDGFIAASYEPEPGWRVRVIRERLDRPIETDVGPISEQVGRIVWIGDGSAAGSIPPGAFRDFPISVRVPDAPGSTLTFKALQTYDSGEVVRWIGEPGSDEPAATVAVTAAAGPGDGAGAGHADPTVADDASATDRAAVAADAQAPDGGGDSGSGLAVAALVLAAIAALIGASAALLSVRRQAPADPDPGHQQRSTR